MAKKQKEQVDTKKQKKHVEENVEAKPEKQKKHVEENVEAKPERQDHEKNWESPKGFFRTRDTSKKMELVEKMKKIQASKKKSRKKKVKKKSSAVSTGNKK
ncbi:MAG: hypothetical protein QGH40_07395 [bacterium]|jgi:hypothetical protein|nr:hypothetical protein [bacterium]